MGDPLPRSHDLRCRVRKRGFIPYPWFFAVPELSRNYLSYEGDIVVSAAGMAASAGMAVVSAAGMRPEGAVALAVGTATGAKSIDHRVD